MTRTAPYVVIVPDNAALSRKAAQEFYRCASDAIVARGRFAVALSGGSTPRGLYELLARDQESGDAHLPWEKVFVFFGDERHVPPTDSQSNYRMAKEAFLDRLPIPPGNIFRIEAELDAEAAARRYEEKLRSFYTLAPGAWPRFDLILLGLGDDGHTASLFPASAALAEQSRLAVANWVEKLDTWRITLTYPVLNHAAEVMFVVSGRKKAEIVTQVFSTRESGKFPSQNVMPEDGRIVWMLDEDAACLL